MAQKLTVSNNGLELTNCLQQWLMENSETKKRSCYERLKTKRAIDVGGHFSEKSHRKPESSLDRTEIRTYSDIRTLWLEKSFYLQKFFVCEWNFTKLL